MVGVGGEGALVVLFGAVVVAAHGGEEVRVVAEGVGVVGVGGEGALVVLFGAVVVAAHVGEEERVVAEGVGVVGVGGEGALVHAVGVVGVASMAKRDGVGTKRSRVVRHPSRRDLGREEPGRVVPCEASRCAEDERGCRALRAARDGRAEGRIVVAEQPVRMGDVRCGRRPRCAAAGVGQQECLQHLPSGWFGTQPRDITLVRLEGPARSPSVRCSAGRHLRRGPDPRFSAAAVEPVVKE